MRDQDNVAIVRLWCKECDREFGGCGGDHSKQAINNLFTNFKKSHLMSNLHVKNWCRRKDITFDSHPQSMATKGKPIILTVADHRNVVVGIKSFDTINEPFLLSDWPFALVGDPKALELKSFWYKVSVYIV